MQAVSEAEAPAPNNKKKHDIETTPKALWSFVKVKFLVKAGLQSEPYRSDRLSASPASRSQWQSHNLLTTRTDPFVRCNDALSSAAARDSPVPLDMPADSRKPLRGSPPLRFVLPALLIVAGLGGLLLYLEQGDSGARHDADLCPLDTDSLAGSATLLVDFRKPLDPFGLSLPGTALRDLSLGLARATELRIFALTGDMDAPRQLVGKLCKPYDNTDLSIRTAKDQRGVVRDCDDVPAQVPARVRELAGGFCERRAALQDRIYAMARRPVEGAVVNAHLVAALDDTLLEFKGRPRPHALHVFSDMMQHSDWYSHLDLDWTEWGFEEFLARREASYPSLDYVPDMAGQSVHIYYLPRRGRTGQPRMESAHKQFWREYFRGAQVAFQDQPAMSGYDALPLMDIPTEAEIAAQERDVAERLLARVQEERAMLAEAREEVREQARREMEEALRPRQAEPDAEVERLRAEAEAAAARQDAVVADGGEMPEGEIVPATPAVSRSARQDPIIAGNADRPEEPRDDNGGIVPATEAAGEDPAARDGVFGDLATPEPPRCQVALAPGSAPTAAYPRGGDFNFGDAVILVRFTVDEEGATPDDEVVVDRDGSSAGRSRNLETFAETARQTVRRWEFEFEDPDDGVCVKRQKLSIAFEFQYD